MLLKYKVEYVISIQKHVLLVGIVYNVAILI